MQGAPPQAQGQGTLQPYCGGLSLECRESARACPSAVFVSGAQPGCPALSPSLSTSGFSFHHLSTKSPGPPFPCFLKDELIRPVAPSAPP